MTVLTVQLFPGIPSSGPKKFTDDCFYSHVFTKRALSISFLSALLCYDGKRVPSNKLCRPDRSGIRAYIKVVVLHKVADTRKVLK